MATRFTLRTIKCPGCGANVPYQPGSAQLTCEYCGTTMQVVAKQPDQPKRRLPQQPQPGPARVTPHVRPLVTAMAVMIPILLTTGLSWYIAMSPASMPSASTGETSSQDRATPTPSNSTVPAPPPIAEPELEPEPDGEAPTEPTQAEAPETEKPTSTATAAPKKKRPPKPNPYDVSRLIFPQFKSCPPNDLTAPGHPVWYSATVTLSIKSGAFTDVAVSVESSDTDLAKIHFKSDYEREVTQADLDRRKAKTKQCVTAAIKSTSIPAGNALSKTEGKIRMSFTHDGVPYGVKKL